ncbi:MAG: hypothetical protein C6Y22_23720 [Hapalosiphonaceae cyanobacterium JJU2]|nr:MAG: hypothetical protein C6Y22_23720 [Hapalosiphonaceae cyanobacterium JJU2]
MPKSQKKAEILSVLSQIQENPTTEEAIAMLRNEQAFEFLISLIAEGKHLVVQLSKVLLFVDRLL